MKLVKSNYRKKLVILLLLSFGMIFANIGFSSINFPLNFTSIKEETNRENDLDYQIQIPKTSSSPTSFSSSGENINLTLHQSYSNNSFNTALSLSDPNSNSFSLPCPKDVTFNSTFTNITIKDIYAPNKTLEIETGVSGSESIRYVDHALSFQIPGDGILDNLSICFSETQLIQEYDASINVELWNAAWNGGFSDWGPSGFIATIKTGLVIINDTSSTWYNITNINQQLDISATNNNMFFIFLTQTTSSSLAEVVFHREADGASDDSKVWKDDGGWQPVAGIDPSMTLHLLPINNTPKPTEVDLKINNDVVTDIERGKGYWESAKVNGSVSGELQYNVSAGWWDVTCNVSKVQINLTKTNIQAISSFDILGSGQTVQWNVTRNGGLNYFDSRFSTYQINFTIPDTWDKDTIKVFNGGISKTSDSTNRSLGNGYREVNVLNAGNGTYWHLTANSTNLLASIDSFDTFDFTGIAHFEATFYNGIGDSDGKINLSVYSPVIWNNDLNYTIDVESFTAGSVISLADWDISDNITKYGDFQVQVSWSNNTAAGFREKIIRIFGETNLVPILPKFIFNASESFDIDVFFNDTGLDAGINDTDITYRLNNGAIRSDDVPIATGLYKIIIDCFDADFNTYGPNFIEINASKTYYNNQSEIVEITILGETELDGSILKSSFDSTETFNVSIFYNDTVKDSDIFGAIRDVYVNSTPYTPISNYDYGDGNYNITIKCDDDIFQSQGYGYFNLSINVEKSYYYNQSSEFIISITGNTSLSTTKLPDPSIGYYNSDEMFNITVHFEDTSRGEGIDGGVAKIYVKEVSASSYQEYIPVKNDPIGAGDYNITVDCSDPLFNPYGKYNIKINITKSHYYTAEDILGEIVVGNTTLTILNPIGPVSYVEDESFDIIIEYEDHTLTSGIDGADITYTINGTGYISNNWIDNSDGTYNINIDAGDVDFGNNYGYVDIIIRANKTNYINLTRTLTFERQILTQITPFNNPPLVEVMKGVNVTYTFNYSDTSGNPIVEYDNFQRTSPFVGFQYHLRNDGNGNYTLDIDTSNIGVIVDPYSLNFSISVFGNQSQKISLTILVTIKQTNIEIESWNNNADFARSTWTNVSIDFYFNDTTNIEAIDGLTDSNVIIRDYDTGVLWGPGFELFTRPGPGNYKLNISTVNKNSGLYTLQLNISKYPDYNWSLAYVQFYLRGNYTQINMISVSDPEATLISTGIGNNYTTFIVSDLTIEFNITDTESNDKVVIGDANEYIITFKNLVTGFTGTLQESLSFVPITVDYGIYTGSIVTSVLTANRFYLINVTVVKSNYENTTFSFNLTLVNSQINIILISNQGGQLEPSGFGNYYNSTVALDLNLEFNITDTESLFRTIERDATAYLVKYINLGTGQNGTIINSLTFNNPTSKYIGTLTTSGLGVGNYLINVSVVILNYIIMPLTFNATNFQFNNCLRK